MNNKKKLTDNGFTSGRSVAKNTILNLIGTLIPMIAGVITIPILIRHLGTDRFAVITIAWMLIGYFSLFDMGIGRALTQLIADKIGKNEYDDIPGIFWTAMSLMLVFSVAGALTIALFASPLVHNVLKVPAALQSETISALYIMAISIPFVIMNAAFIGVITAYNRFDIINAIRIPMGTYTYAAPLLVLPFSNNLIFIISTLLIGRVVTFLIHLWYCFQIVPKLSNKIVIQISIIKPLLKFGGWMTVSNILGPIMVTFDRFLIGSVISISAVAYYTTPYELITKICIIPGALMSVLFPVFASVTTMDCSHTAKLFHRAVKYQVFVIFPIVLTIVAFAHQGFTLWLGTQFADNSYRVLQWLAIGVFINCLAHVPFTFLQGIGKPDVTAKLHVSELVLYIPALWLLVKHFGISGAAIAWSARVAIDAALLFWVTNKSFRPFSGISYSTGSSTLASIMCLVGIAIFPEGRLMFVVFTVIILIFVATCWKILLSVDERLYLISKLSNIRIIKK